MSPYISVLAHKRFYLFILSIILFTASMFGPPGVKVAHLFTTFDFQSIFNILFQHEEAFRLPDTTLRVVVFSIGFL